MQKNSREGREINRPYINKKANAKQLAPGDTVVLLAPKPLTFTSRWDPQWQITRISGVTCYLQNQVSGETKTIHRDHVKLVDPDLAWDQLPPRPKRSRRRPVWEVPEKNNIAQNHLYRNNATDQHVQTNNPKVQIENLSLDQHDIIEMDDPDLQPKDNCLDPDDTQLSNTLVNSNDLSHILENDLQIIPEPLPNTYTYRLK